MLWTSRCNGGPIFKVVPEGVKNIQILKIADFTIFAICLSMAPCKTTSSPCCGLSFDATNLPHS